jgi:hypothetical protein
MHVETPSCDITDKMALRRSFWPPDEGRLFDDQAMFDRLMLTGQYIPIPELEILVLFDYFCDPSLSLWKASPSSVSRPVTDLNKRDRAAGHHAPASLASTV